MKTSITKKALSMALAAAIFSTITSTAYAYSGNYDYLFTYDNDSVTSSTDEDGAGDSAAYTIDGTVITIKGVGTYVVTGSSENGSISVKKDTDGVTLIFEDLTLSYAGDEENTDTVTVGKNSTVDIVIEGDNTLTNTNEDGAAVKIKSGASVTITGDGTLEVDASEGKNGIKGAENATLTIGENADDSFILTVSAANNGIASDGSVVVNGGTVNITSDGDGLKSSPDEGDETSEGTVTINNGTINIVSGEDGVQGDGGFTMNDGTLNIVAGGGSANASDLDEDTSAKGIKSDSYILIAGGDITIDSADDGIHLNGTTGNEEINITSGTLTISSGDDGIKSDYTLNIGTEGSEEGPEINITKSYEGLEGTQVNLNSGTGTINSSDDGINAANSDLTNGDFDINISGGKWTINAGGDGLDSNGDITVTGGDTTVFGAADNGNAALDVGDNGGKLTVTGGSLTGIGMSGMAIVPSSGTYVQFGSSGMGGAPGQTRQSSGISISAGAAVEIRDADGNTVYSTTAAKSANSIVFASDELTAGGTYTLYVNGKSSVSATAAEGNGSTGAMTPGGAPGGMPGGQNGQNGQNDQPGQPPEIPNGQNGQNEQPGQPPEMPSGQNGQNEQPGQPPEMPNGQNGQNEQPGQLPEMPNGQNGQNGQNEQPGQPPEIPNGQNGQNEQPGQPPEMPNGQNGQNEQPGQPPEMPNGQNGQDGQNDQPGQPYEPAPSITADPDIYRYPGTSAYVWEPVPCRIINIVSPTVSSETDENRSAKEQAASALERMLTESNGKVTFDKVEKFFDSIGFDYKGSDALIVGNRYIIRSGWSKDAAELLNEMLKKGTIKLTDSTGKSCSEIMSLPAASASGLAELTVIFELG